MTTKRQSAGASTDPAAVFACALSLWRACHEAEAKTKDLELSECFNGIDQLMREVMAVGNCFEEWACQHVNFDELNDVWPYVLEEKFGRACLDLLSPSGIPQFNENDCLWIALHLRFPVVLDDRLPIPLNVSVPNPTTGTGFCEFKIQTLHNSLEGGEVVPFAVDDDPFDEEYGEPYFGLYGVDKDGQVEHIADRRTYRELLNLIEKLAPGIAFPKAPTFSASGSERG